MSVTDISQKFEKKNPPLPLKPLPNVPFLYRQSLPPPHHSLIHLSDPLSPPSEECSTLLILVNNNNNKKEKKNSRGFTPLFKIKSCFCTG